MMRAVLLAGGTGSRLGMLTAVTNKHLLPVGDEPMLMHGLRRIAEIGIDRVLVVTGTEHAGDVYRFVAEVAPGLHIDPTFMVQQRAGGIADAIGLARDYVRDDPFMVLLGDNVFGAPLLSHARSFIERVADSWGGMVLLKRHLRPDRFGVAILNQSGAILEFVEKPRHPVPSDLVVIGCYFYQGQGIFDVINELRPSARGELEVTDLHSALLRAGRLRYMTYDGDWTDAGTPESYRTACDTAWRGTAGDRRVGDQR